MEQILKEIRQKISDAKQFELHQGHLLTLIKGQLNQLHGAIRLPEEDGAASLAEFVTRYVEHVPDFIQAISVMTQEAGIHNYADPFLQLAGDFFLQPPALLEGHQGMDALMDEAYLAHRLLEEINDRFIGHSGMPLAPMDMTRANLIIHYLVGEPFANELDEAVHQAVEKLMHQEQVFDDPDFQAYLEEHRERGWSEELERWPCLAEDLAIHLQFGQTI